MNAPPVLLDARVTDVFGAGKNQPLVVRLEGGFAHLEMEGCSWMVDAEELREALEPKREIRAA